MKTKESSPAKSRSPSVSANGTDHSPSPPAAKKHAVFLVEDHPITRTGLCALIDLEPDFYVCGQTDSAAAAVEQVTRLLPAIVVTDIALRTSNGIELIKNLIAIRPHQPILAMSMYNEDLYAERAMRAGAGGYLMKSEATEKFLPALRAVLGGEVYLSDKMKGKLISGLLQRKSKTDVTFTMDTLSDRELEVFQLIGNGFTTREIADRLNLSTKTIDSYREHLKVKLGLDTGAELVRRAIEWMRLETVDKS